MSDKKRRNSADRPAEGLYEKRRKYFNDHDDDSSSNKGVDVIPPLRSSQNLWVAATVGKDPSIVATDRDKRFAEGNNRCDYIMML